MKKIVRIIKLKLLFIIIFILFTVSGYCKVVFICEDTPYEVYPQESIIKSNYHLFQIYGDISYRNTNIFKNNYNSAVLWLVNRFYFPRFSKLIESIIPLPDPYLTGIFKNTNNIFWEDRLDYGLGIEWFPLSKLEFSNCYILNWIRHLRIYIDFLKTTYFQNSIEWNNRPDYDFRISIELYRECNLYNFNKYWSETWTNLSWRRTDFFKDNYKNLIFGFVHKAGIKFYPRNEFIIMPYISGEVSLTGYKEFWNNRALLGLGIRIMPFRWQDSLAGVFLRGTKFYIEAVKVVDYFVKEDPKETPDYDVRIGFIFAILDW